MQRMLKQESFGCELQQWRMQLRWHKHKQKRIQDPQTEEESLQNVKGAVGSKELGAYE